jgi:hypothetical protein
VRRRLTSPWHSGKRSISRALTSAATLALFCLLPSAFCLRAQAQFSLDWWTIDGGGGQSSGGSFTVTGTIGQPDAGRMSGGTFTVEGGFWAIVAVEAPQGPTMGIERQVGSVKVYWPLSANGWVLEKTTTLSGNPIPWQTLNPPYASDAQHYYLLVSPPTGTTFYRLRKP